MLTTPEVLPRPALLAAPACRLCGGCLRTVLNFGRMPLARGTLAFGEPARLHRLHIQMCDSCLLVQVQEPVTPDPGPRKVAHTPPANDHARRFAAALRQRLALGDSSLVVEIGDGMPGLRRQFEQAAVPVLAEAAELTAASAMEIAARSGRADVVLANDRLASAADLFDFAAGFTALLRPKGILVLEVPHLLPIIQKVQFDAFQHHRRFYLSLMVIEQLLRSVGLRVFDAEKLPQHGGSLRIYACHPRAPHATRPALKVIRQAEAAAGLDRHEVYEAYTARVAAARQDIREFVANRRAAGRRMAAYGLATRGTALLNACGLGAADVAWVADPTGVAKGRFLPGCGIPVVDAQALRDDRPSDLLILPWPHAAELVAGLQPLRQKGSQIWTLTPAIRRA